MIPIVGATEDEATALAARYAAARNVDAVLTFLSGAMNVDLSALNLDERVGDFTTDAHQGTLLSLAEAAPDKDWTWRHLLEMRQSGNHLVGTAEQIVDAMQESFERGIDGFLVSDALRPATYTAFIEHVVPVLQNAASCSASTRRGLFARSSSVIRGFPTAIRGRAPASPATRRRGDCRRGASLARDGGGGRRPRNRSQRHR